MSLINNMLYDLEKRHGNFKDENQIVFDGLAPVTDTGFRDSKIPYNFLLVSCSIVALLFLIFGFFGKPGNYSNNTIDLPANSLSLAVSPAGQDDQFSILTSDIRKLLPQTDPKSLSVFKLDSSLSFQPKISSDPGIAVSTINDINIREIADVTSIELSLSNKAEYTVFTLENPNQLILDLENTEIMTLIPSRLDHSYLQYISIGDQGGENTRLIVDSSRPIQIDSTKILTRGDDYLLSLNLVAKNQDTVKLPNPMDTVPVEKDSSIGQMDISPSSGKSKNNQERYLADVRNLYSQKAFERGDKAIESILQKYPLNIEARTLYASTLINRNNFNSAIQVLASGLRENPGISEWAKLYSQLMVNQGQVNTALVVLERALPEITTDFDYYAMYAALLQRDARHTDAIKHYKSLLVYKPENGLWWMGLAISQDAINDSTNAHYSYSMALQGQSINYELRQYILQQIQRLSN